MLKPLRSSKFTAIARNKPSIPARNALNAYSNKFLKKGTRVLDYGCGRGFDVAWLRSQGIDADGHDPNIYQSVTPLRGQQYDFILCTYVLNVIQSNFSRKMAIKRVINSLKDFGIAYFTTRTDTEILAEAAKNSWTPYKDGWITNSKTFQIGFSSQTLLELLTEATREMNLESKCYLLFTVEPSIKQSSVSVQVLLSNPKLNKITKTKKK